MQKKLKTSSADKARMKTDIFDSELSAFQLKAALVPVYLFSWKLFYVFLACGSKSVHFILILILVLVFEIYDCYSLNTVKEPLRSRQVIISRIVFDTFKTSKFYLLSIIR